MDAINAKKARETADEHFEIQFKKSIETINVEIKAAAEMGHYSTSVVLNERNGKLATKIGEHFTNQGFRVKIVHRPLVLEIAINW